VYRDSNQMNLFLEVISADWGWNCISFDCCDVTVKLSRSCTRSVLFMHELARYMLVRQSV